MCQANTLSIVQTNGLKGETRTDRSHQKALTYSSLLFPLTLLVHFNPYHHLVNQNGKDLKTQTWGLYLSFACAWVDSEWSINSPVYSNSWRCQGYKTEFNNEKKERKKERKSHVIKPLAAWSPWNWYSCILFLLLFSSLCVCFLLQDADKRGSPLPSISSNNSLYSLGDIKGHCVRSSLTSAVSPGGEHRTTKSRLNCLRDPVTPDRVLSVVHANTTRLALESKERFARKRGRYSTAWKLQ